AAALHFLSYVASLSFTSVAHALSITYLAPAFIALASWRLFGEKLALRQVGGMLLSLAGIAIMVGFQPRLTGRMLLGDLLALVAALCFAAYSLAGRSQRQRYGLLPYAT